IPAGSKAGAVAQVFDRACQGLSRGRALGRRCAGGKAALHFLAACWSRYKWPHIKEAYESTGFFESRRLTMSIGNKRIAVIALGLALSALASPSFAQRSENHMSGAREQALRECNLAAQKY